MCGTTSARCSCRGTRKKTWLTSLSAAVLANNGGKDKRSQKPTGERAPPLIGPPPLYLERNQGNHLRGRGIVVESVVTEHSEELVELEDRRLGTILLYTELLKSLYPGEGLGKVVREFFKEFFSLAELARIDATLLERKNDAMVRISPYLRGFFDKLKEEGKE